MAMPLFESALAADAKFLVLMMSADDVLRRESSQLLTGTQPWMNSVRTEKTLDRFFERSFVSS